MITAKQALQKSKASIDDHSSLLMTVAERGIKEAAGKGLQSFIMYTIEPCNYTFMSDMKGLGYAIVYGVQTLPACRDYYKITW